MVFDGKKERERSREGARAWLGSGEAHAEENKTVPAHVTYMGISLLFSFTYEHPTKLWRVKSSDSNMLRMASITCLCSFPNAS